MFTGIVERTATVAAVEDTGGGRRLRIRVASDGGSDASTVDLPPWRRVDLGESIAIDGVCLTAIEARELAGGGEVVFEAVPETLGRTTLQSLRAGDRVNVERSLRAGDPLGGHWVTGHVDGLGRIESRTPEGDQVLFRIAAPAPIIRFVIPKGSIAVDGVSLTVIDVDRVHETFTFAAIPHTLARTTLGAAAAGDQVNLETDAFGKWVVHALDVGIVEPPAGRAR